MSKSVIFRIGEGSFESGFPLTLEILDDGKLCADEINGRLSKDFDISDLYQEYRQAYYDWGEKRRWLRRQINVSEQIETNIPHNKDEVKQAKEKIERAKTALEKGLNSWLNRSDLQDIRGKISNAVAENEDVRFFFKTDDPNLQALPWERWKFLQDFYSYPEVALCFFRSPKKISLNLPLKVLVILGCDDQINNQVDWQLLQTHLLPEAELILLPQPSPLELQEKLVSQSPDVIFFAGHSYTRLNSNDGTILINSNDDISLNQLTPNFRIAANNGLQVAIFNSCDGLGLARNLAALRIPHIIVMREPIPDTVAEQFLNNFLYNWKAGKSLQEAVKEARRNLLLIEHKSPSASLLPVIIQNTEESPCYFPVKPEEPSPREEPEELPPEPIPPVNLTLLTQIKQQLLDNKIVRFILLTVLGLLLTYLAWIIINPRPLLTVCPTKSALLSCGEKQNFINYPTQLRALNEEEDGIEQFAQKNYKEAVKLLTEAWEKDKDPSTLIRLNNAIIMRDLATGLMNKNDVFPIAVTVSYKDLREFISKNILSGVAWRQNEFNTQGSLKLLVVMADDYHDKGRGEDIARELGKMKDILGVVGPYSSHVTYHVIDEYRAADLSLVSPTSTASKSNYPNPNLDTSLFFRAVTTTQFSAPKLVDYLVKNGYQRVYIFFNDQELFGLSFYLDFKESLKSSNLETIGEKRFIDINAPEKFKKLIEDLKKQYKDVKETTALVLLTGAYTTNPDHPKKIQIIQANQGEFFIAGSNTLYDNEVLELYNKIQKEALENKEDIESMVVTVPWFPSDTQIKNFQNIFGKEQKLTWHSILAHDATQILIQAIKNERELGKRSTRQSIQKTLVDPNFETQGLTGKISFNGSDQEQQYTFLISPDCSSNDCTWKEIEKYSSQ